MLMEDVSCQGKNVTGLTTVATIPMKPTAVCLCLKLNMHYRLGD